MDCKHTNIWYAQSERMCYPAKVDNETGNVIVDYDRGEFSDDAQDQAVYCDECNEDITNKFDGRDIG